MAEKHLTINELAARMDVPLATIYQWNSRGIGPRYLKVGRHVRYRLADVLEWEKQRAVEPLGSIRAKAG